MSATLVRIAGKERGESDDRLLAHIQDEEMEKAESIILEKIRIAERNYLPYLRTPLTVTEKERDVELGKYHPPIPICGLHESETEGNHKCICSEGNLLEIEQSAVQGSLRSFLNTADGSIFRARVLEYQLSSKEIDNDCLILEIRKS